MLCFTKMHGCGNDYIYFNCFDGVPPEPGKLAEELSRRRFSVGGDGIVLICPSDVADAKMRMFNADGSEGKMCGNAIRCVGKYLYDNGMVSSEKLEIETLSGIKTLFLHISGGKVDTVTVDMGAPVFETALIPALLPCEKAVGYEHDYACGRYRITCVSMGNPHAVIFTDGIDSMDLEKYGPVFENDPAFPERVNTEFVEPVDSATLKMRVWERGSGETLACGTGACAAVCAAAENGLVPQGKEITVRLRGGELYITYTGNTVLMRGEAVKVYDGTLEDI